MPPSLPSSYAYCHQVMRTAARNFYFGMRLLPEAKRNGMYALYGFMRLIDDLADDPIQGDFQTSRRDLLNDWRDQTRAAIDSPLDTHPIWPAFHDTVRRFNIPPSIFDDAIDGQIQDLEQSVYDTFDDLYRYCYRVASTVGLAALHIWGFNDPRALKLAEHRGIAMQLTNILRDIREDTERGRQYLPTEDLHRFGLSLPTLADPANHRRFEDMLHFQTRRAHDYYDQSAGLESLIHPDARPTLCIMTSIYRGILNRIAAAPRAVLIGRVRLGTLEKLTVVARHTWRAHTAPLRA